MQKIKKLWEEVFTTVEFPESEAENITDKASEGYVKTSQTNLLNWGNRGFAALKKLLDSVSREVGSKETYKNYLKSLDSTATSETETSAFLKFLSHTAENTSNFRSKSILESLKKLFSGGKS